MFQRYGLFYLQIDCHIFFPQNVFFKSCVEMFFSKMLQNMWIFAVLSHFSHKMYLAQRDWLIFSQIRFLQLLISIFHRTPRAWPRCTSAWYPLLRLVQGAKEPPRLPQVWRSARHCCTTTPPLARRTCRGGRRCTRWANYSKIYFVNCWWRYIRKNAMMPRGKRDIFGNSTMFQLRETFSAAKDFFPIYCRWVCRMEKLKKRWKNTRLEWKQIQLIVLITKHRCSCWFPRITPPSWNRHLRRYPPCTQNLRGRLQYTKHVSQTV